MSFKIQNSKFYILNSIRRGFTLVELLVVIATISLLLSILMPSLGKARSMAKRLGCASNLKQIDLAVRLYLDSNNDTYPCADDPVSVNPFYCLWMGRGWRSFVEPYLGGSIDVNNPSVLFCPEDRTEPEKYESTSYAYSMAFYHSSEQIDDMKDKSDTWSSFSPDVPSIPQRILNVVKPTEKIIIGEWNSNHLRVDDDKGWWCWEGSRNYLFVDGHVRFLNAKEEIRPANDGWPDINLTNHGIKGIDFPQY
jgi:prepilin-type N-terminal cleavage/methylation domain-containing protein/prepilin-type processing-associated H-X9-DG protein